MKHYFIRIVFFSFLYCVSKNTHAQVKADAGSDQTICPGTAVTLGGTPTAFDGKPPYTYKWLPTTALNDTTIANPVAKPVVSTKYYVIVTDSSDNTVKDSVTITIDAIAMVNAGKDTNLCDSGSVKLGSSANAQINGVTFSWAPAADLNNAAAPNPIARPKSTTTYTLTAGSATCQNITSSVTVKVSSSPKIDAGSDVTINAGESVKLTASGGLKYFWSPNKTLKNATTASPNAEPKKTTTYIVMASLDEVCWGFDTVTIYVNEYEDPIFYNAFTPNYDGENETWFIGNLEKFPDNKLEIYNRYGKLIYMKFRYDNSWTGRSFGDELPAATYYYIFYPGTERAAYKGSVTIIR